MSDQDLDSNLLYPEDNPLRSTPEEGPPAESDDGSNPLAPIWELIMLVGQADVVLRVLTFAATLVLVLGVIYGMRTLFFAAPAGSAIGQTGVGAVDIQETITPTPVPPILPAYAAEGGDPVAGVERLASIYTIIPSRPRVDVITYTVQTGDSVIRIAERFGLKPETILWGNYAVLADNPHSLQTDQVLQILPADGTLHKWIPGENLEKVADFYEVSAANIIEWPGNPFDVYNTDVANPGLPAGTVLIVPGGQREMIDYGPPRIPRDDPAVARTYGPGHCGTVMDGALGDGTFIWPTLEQWVTGYDYSPNTNHWGIDIAGVLGNEVWSVDNGVVVYSGWSNNGYGNLVVIDHGNGFQSLYAHMNEIYVACGESVYQGTTLGTLGSTGESSGPHLHFELIYGTTKVNPWDFLP